MECLQSTEQVTLLFIFLYFASKGLQDYSMKSGKGFDWKAKYKQPLVPTIAIKNKLYKWYHERFNLSYKEKFLFSGTLLVSLSDSWHTFGLIRRLIIYSFGFYVVHFNLLYMGLIVVIGLISFHITYSFIRR